MLGICNGFQILTEAQLLPGALLRNAALRFLSRDCHLRVERAGTRVHPALPAGPGVPCADGPWRRQLHGRPGGAGPAGGGRPGGVPLRDGGGEVAAAANPNGSARAIAGVFSANHRVLGLMPHPEDLVDPLMGGTDGAPLFAGLVEALAA